MLAAVGKDERKRITDRTRDALKAAKAQGVKLGNPRWNESVEAARGVRSLGSRQAYQHVTADHGRPSVERHRYPDRPRQCVERARHQDRTAGGIRRR